MRHLHANGRRQAIAHGAQAPGRHPAVGRLEMIVLRSPHLVLADFRRDVGIATLCQLIETLDRILRLDGFHRRPERQRLALAPVVDLLPPAIHRSLVG